MKTESVARMSSAAPRGNPLRTIVVWMIFIVSVHTFAEAWAQSLSLTDEQIQQDAAPVSDWGDHPDAVPPFIAQP